MSQGSKVILIDSDTNRQIPDGLLRKSKAAFFCWHSGFSRSVVSFRSVLISKDAQAPKRKQYTGVPWHQGHMDVFKEHLQQVCKHQTLSFKSLMSSYMTSWIKFFVKPFSHLILKVVCYNSKSSFICVAHFKSDFDRITWSWRRLQVLL